MAVQWGRNELAREMLMSQANDGERRTHLGAYALCVDASDRLLLCRVSKGYADEGHWTLPGGGMDWGEAPDCAVLRELQEETGLTASHVELCDRVFSAVYPPAEGGLLKPLHHVGILFRANALAGELRAEGSGTTDGCAWFSREDAKQLPLTPLGRFSLTVAWQGPAGRDLGAGR
jgi:ADP-ribose pyrophosphatase YjhB (NUDIX family)